MLILYISLFGFVLHTSSGYKCVCAKSEISIHMYANISSPKVGQFSKGECVSFDRAREIGHWMEVAEDKHFGYVPVDDMSIQNCQEYKENSSNRIKRFILGLSCDNYDTCKVCICEHPGDWHYANEHKECYSCWGCLGKVKCDNQHEHHMHQTTKPETPKPIVTTTTIKPIPTTTAILAAEHKCDKLSVLQVLAEETYLRNKTCTKSSDADSHNFLMEQCNALPHRHQWIQKRKIIDHCDKILPYTAVGSKTYGIYGSFVGCHVNDNGAHELKIATQFCNKPAEVIHIPDTTNQHGYGIPR